MWPAVARTTARSGGATSVAASRLVPSYSSSVGGTSTRSMPMAHRRFKLGYIDGGVGTGMLKTIRFGAAASSPPSSSTFSSTSSSSKVDGLVRKHGVVVFSSSFCPYCAMAVDALEAAGVAHVVVEVDAGIKRELMSKTGRSSVPSVWVKGTFIGGCNDGPEPWMGVNPCLSSGKLQRLLEGEK